MSFWFGFGVGAFLMFALLLTYALLATAHEADAGLERYARDLRAERELYVVPSLDLPTPPKQERPRT